MSPLASEVLSFLKNHPEKPWFPDGQNWQKLDDKSWLIPFWGEDYQAVLKLQYALRDFLRLHPLWHFHLIGHHPSCLTMGRGLQKGVPSTLFSSNTSRPSTFPIPLYQIERGGDLTFHFPGQLIWYHLAKLHPERWPLNFHLDHMMKTTAHIVKETTGVELILKRNPLGLWSDENKKIASIGIGVTHHVTTHGLALNVNWEGIERSLLLALSPCGLSGDIYRALSDLTQVTETAQNISPKSLGLNLSKFLLGPVPVPSKE